MRPKREVEDPSSPRRRFSRRARQPALPRSTQGHDRDRGLTDAGARRSCRALRGLRRDSHLPQFRLMGRSSNGELACRHRHFSVNCGALCLHYRAILRLRQVGHRWPVTNGDEHVGDLLLGIEDAGHLPSGPSGPYLDGFAAALERQGYKRPHQQTGAEFAVAHDSR